MNETSAYEVATGKSRKQFEAAVGKLDLHVQFLDKVEEK